MNANTELQYYSYDLACTLAMENNIICDSKDEFAKKIEETVVLHAYAAAYKSIKAGFIPIFAFGAFFSDSICSKAVKHMCGEICTLCGIECSDDLLKTFGSSIKKEVDFKFILSQAVFKSYFRALRGYNDFIMVYLYGIVCVRVINDIVSSGTNINEMGKNAFNNAVNIVLHDINIKQILSQTNNIFREISENGQINTLGKAIDF